MVVLELRNFSSGGTGLVFSGTAGGSVEAGVGMGSLEAHWCLRKTGEVILYDLKLADDC